MVNLYISCVYIYIYIYRYGQIKDACAIKLSQTFIFVHGVSILELLGSRHMGWGMWGVTNI
jgi:hypothetical protein